MKHRSDPAARDTTRRAGLLLHPTSLPSRYGIGDLGDELIEVLDWAKAAGITIWQTLPMNPPGFGNSPYGCLSSFAGNPLLISPQRLLKDELLPPNALDDVPPFDDNHVVDFGAVAEFKNALLRKSYTHFIDNARPDHQTELAKFSREHIWLSEWGLYAALKNSNGGKQWSAWDRPLAMREPEALASAERELAAEIRFHNYVQWLFFRQWSAVRDAAEARGIRIMGDVPIYVACDSADVWANRELFQLNADGEPTVVAGVPPDYFSDTGQRWGNPLYRWDLLRQEHYRWWVARIRASLRFADIIRIDHFRGFAAYWEVPASEPTAIHGRWMPGPGRALFDAIRDSLGDVPLVAEDLGFITPEVHELRHSIGIPGMKILQFAFGQVNSAHLPHCYEPDTVVYTGTHDNDTARGWFESTSDDEREIALAYLGAGREEIEWAMIRAAYTSVARTAIVPLQDILGIGSEARMNRPGDSSDNWAWRFETGVLTRDRADRLRKLAEISGRI
ncbi:MAG: 4-alpha-glucanotransferase [Acidobacteriota bacterium]|nr:4-alpha-glucanotransferase [Acidobacteriota bacterium]